MPLRYPMPAMQVADYIRQQRAANAQRRPPVYNPYTPSQHFGYDPYSAAGRQRWEAEAAAQRAAHPYAGGGETRAQTPGAFPGGGAYNAASRAQPPRYFGGPVGGFSAMPDVQRRYQMMMAARQAAQPRGGYMGGGYGGGGPYGGNPGFYRGGGGGY